MEEATTVMTQGESVLQLEQAQAVFGATSPLPPEQQALDGAKVKKGGGKRPRPGSGDPKEQRAPAATRQPKGK